MGTAMMIALTTIFAAGSLLLVIAGYITAAAEA
jgi:hypothetical protein